MQITPASVVSGIEKLSSANKVNQEQSFTNILNDAINNVQETETEAKQDSVDLLTGANDSIHTVMIEAEKAELALNLAIQVRNKVIDSYNTIMGMQL